MSEPTIPPGIDMAIEIAAIRAHVKDVEDRAIKQLAIVESERDRLAERLKRAEGLLRRLAKPCRCGKPGCGFHDAAAFLAESNSTEKKA